MHTHSHTHQHTHTHIHEDIIKDEWIHMWILNEETKRKNFWFAPLQGRTTLCCLYVVVYGSYLRCATRSTHVCIIHGGVNCLNSVPYRCYTYRHWFHWTAVWLQLHVSLVHVSACSFAVSQASDLALLVGYVA